MKAFTTQKELVYALDTGIRRLRKDTQRDLLADTPVFPSSVARASDFSYVNCHCLWAVCTSKKRMHLW
jgi:hypothetical protein